VVLKRGPLSVSFFQMVARTPLTRISCAGGCLFAAGFAGFVVVLMLIKPGTPEGRDIPFLKQIPVQGNPKNRVIGFADGTVSNHGLKPLRGQWKKCV
jgi:hypothetical protein